jgi:hypothetical protein
MFDHMKADKTCTARDEQIAFNHLLSPMLSKSFALATRPSGQPPIPRTKVFENC